MLNQSVCLYGEPIDVPKMMPGKEMVIHAWGISTRLSAMREYLEKDKTEEKIKKKCTWFMKALLRVGAEITMERSKKYTRDLYPCYEIFAEYYPEKEAEMRNILDLALNPTADKEKIREVVDTFATWLSLEASAQFTSRSS